MANHPLMDYPAQKGSRHYVVARSFLGISHSIWYDCSEAALRASIGEGRVVLIKELLGTERADIDSLMLKYGMKGVR